MNSNKYTLLGILTIVIWGTSAAFTKNLSTGLGPYTAAAVVNVIGGAVVISHQFFTKGGIKQYKGVPGKYWIVCGGLFVIYTAASYVSMEMVSSEAEIMTMVLIRFLWPLFTLVLTIPILKRKAGPWLAVGVFVSFSGIIIAKMGGSVSHPLAVFGDILSGNRMAYFMGFIVSLSWAFYTNLSKKYLGQKSVDGVGIYMIVSALILGAISLFLPEPREFTPRLVGEMLYQAIAVSCIANVLWMVSIKRGNMLVVVLASNFLPIISTFITAWMLGLSITMPVIAGSVLVVAGTIWSKRCFAEREKVGE